MHPTNKGKIISFLTVLITMNLLNVLHFMFYYIHVSTLCTCFVLDIEKSQKKKKPNENNEDNNDEYVLLDTNEPEKEISVDKGELISVAKLYAKRENTIQSYKQRIGLLASNLLENPDLKVSSFVFCNSGLLDLFLKKIVFFTTNLQYDFYFKIKFSLILYYYLHSLVTQLFGYIFLYNFQFFFFFLL